MTATQRGDFRSRRHCRYCPKLATAACGCCCSECDSPAPIRVRKFMDMDAYDPSPEPVVRRVS